MSLEIEAKMHVTELEVIRQRLRTAGAATGGRVLETNTFFDTERGTLRASDQGLRLRVNEDMAGGGRTIVLTWKGPRQGGPLKSREEIELLVDDEAGAAALLERLGYAPVLTFAKKRESWRLGACSVELDELPYLGTFVEIEGPDEAAVLAARQRLGLADAEIIHASYIALLIEHLERHGITSRDIRFA